MQPIIIGVDFSNTSLHAVEYAIGLANKMRSNIILVWVDKITVQENVYPEPQPESKNEIKKRFEEMISGIKPKLDKGLSLEYKLKKGKIYREIDNLAKSVNAELIVTGRHGISGFEEFWIGSNAYQIVSFTSTPVITVRHDFEISNTINRILVPIGGGKDTIQKLPFAAKMARLFGAEIHLLTYHNNNLKSVQRIADKFTQTAAEYLRKNEVNFVEDSFVSADLTKSLLSYAVNIKADLLTIMTKMDNPVNVHVGARAQQVITQCPIPVLSLSPNEKFELI